MRIRGEKLTVYRGGTGRDGNRVNESTHVVEGVVAWGAGRGSGRFSDSGGGRRESAGMTAHLLVARNADIRARDRIVRANGEAYRVEGHALWDEDFPFDDGYDPNIDDEKVFQIVSMNG